MTVLRIIVSSAESMSARAEFDKKTVLVENNEDGATVNPGEINPVQTTLP